MKQIDKDRKLSKAEYKKYYDYLADMFPICKMCVTEKATQAHHVLYGSYKSDKTIITICNQCHLIAHSNKHKWEAILLPIANANWTEYHTNVIR